MAKNAQIIDVQSWSIEKVRPYPNNPRIISDEGVQAVATSIREFGWRQPIVVDTNGVIVVGHTRFLAAKSLGITTVPVHVAKGLSPEKITAYRVTDNKVADYGAWAFDKLAEELNSISNHGIDLNVVGFTDAELEDILKQLGPDGDSSDDVVGTPEDEPEMIECPHCKKAFTYQG